MAAERKRIGLRDVRALGPGETIWDAAVSGFGARRQKGDAVAYIVFFRTAEGRQRKVTIGRHGAPWTPEEARAEARRILGEVARGADPAAVKRERRAAPTVADLVADYMADAEAGRLLTRRGIAKKPSTIATDRSRVASHILPLLGAMKVAAVTRRDEEGFMTAVAEGRTHRREKLGRKHAVAHVYGGKGTAARTVGFLGAIFTYAVRKGLRPDNPVHGVQRYADGSRERRLSVEEYAALGAALRRLAEVTPGQGGRPDRAPVWPYALAAIRFLALTGWRSGEALGLRWRDVDLASRTARLTDTKTGASLRPLSRRACGVLAGLGRDRDNALVFKPSRGAGTMSGLRSYLGRVMRAAKIEGVTAHTLRHSFASMAADGGASELTIAALLGHRAGSVTAKYTHHADAVLLAAADRVADAVAEAMGEGRPAGEVVALPVRR